MGIVFIFAFFILFFTIVFQVSRNNRFSKQLAIVAEKKELSITKESFFHFPKLEGNINSHFVKLHKETFSYGKSSVATLAFELSFANAQSHPFSLSAKGFMSRVKQLLGEELIRTGDSDFDHKILIHSIFTEWTLSLFSIHARKLITDMMDISYSGKFIINAEGIVQYITLSSLNDEKDIIKILDVLLELADMFSCRENEAVRTAENFMLETNNGAKKVMLKALYKLATGFQGDHPLIRKALKDHDPEVQFYGARLLRGDAGAVLRKLFEKGTIELKSMIVKHLTEKKDAAFLDYFFIKAKNRLFPDLNHEFMLYFTKIRDAKAEPFLREELLAIQHKELNSDHNYTRAVIQALAVCGTFESIEPLYNIRNLFLKRNAEEAIAAIQQRVGAGDSGWLSLSGEITDGGKLSFAEEDEGDA